ncbi:MAG TPA: pyridoxamine 5'-phosphate oxidase family protein [Thermomicrobiales bacterium]|nr:pyridoxamine 5'-phosphate oxidase family protein [Thermomicrobiales bacterium]
MPDDALATLQAAIDRSLAAAGPAILHSFPPESRLSAAEFVAFWGGQRLAALATVSPRGRAHALPITVHLHGATFYLRSEPDAVKMRDIRANPSVALSTWSAEGDIHVMIQGTARELTADERAALPPDLVADAPWGPVAAVAITPTRITARRRS